MRNPKYCAESKNWVFVADIIQKCLGEWSTYNTTAIRLGFNMGKLDILVSEQLTLFLKLQYRK